EKFANRGAWIVPTPVLPSAGRADEVRHHAVEDNESTAAADEGTKRLELGSHVILGMVGVEYRDDRLVGTNRGADSVDDGGIGRASLDELEMRRELVGLESSAIGGANLSIDADHATPAEETADARGEHDG